MRVPIVLGLALAVRVLLPEAAIGCGVAWAAEQKPVARIGEPALFRIVPLDATGNSEGTLLLDIAADLPDGSAPLSAEVAVRSSDVASPVAVGRFVVFPSDTSPQGYAFSMRDVPELDEATLLSLANGKAYIEVSISPLLASLPENAASLRILESTFQK